MPLKWKIFFALNFIMALFAFGFGVLMIIGFSKNGNNSSEDYLYGSLFGFAFVMITVNGFLNMYVIQRFFPDKIMPAGLKRLNIVSLIINLLIVIGMLIAGVLAAEELFAASNRNRDTSGKAALIIFLASQAIQLVLLITQVRLPGIITRNNRESMHSLIDSIGK